MSIKSKIQKLEDQFLNDIKESPLSKDEFDILKNKFLGRKGKIAHLFSEMSGMDNKDKPLAGKLLNQLKSKISQQIDKLERTLENHKDKTTYFDYSLPGTPRNIGSKHPLSIVMDEIKEIFGRIGFSIEYGPEVDTDFYNFEALNIPKHHPARDMQDTFYIDSNVVLRTHTSNTQIHTMMENDPPRYPSSPRQRPAFKVFEDTYYVGF